MSPRRSRTSPKRRRREWIFAWLKNPQAYAVTATMPNFQLSDADARDISAFLMAQSTPYLSAEAPECRATAGARCGRRRRQGASVYGESFCASCHAMQNAAGLMVGGDIGPELTRIGSKVKPEWLAEWVRNPKIYDPATRPCRTTGSREASSFCCTGFLEAKTDSDLLANVHLESATPEQIAHGKALVNERGCAACHAINGISARTTSRRN